MFNKIIGIVSCKGGVGKSTLAVNIAICLSKFYNKKVGLLDADIYGPSHPTLLGINNKKIINEQQITPEIKFNINSISMGYFIKETSSILLRGPMISNTINYLIKNTNWGSLDILIIDFPPGTGDIYLSLLRDFTFNKILLVTIPQIISTIDVKKSILMINKFNIEISGIIENMKYYTCQNCKTKNKIYGEDSSVDNLIKEFKIKNKYILNFDSEISKSCSKGMPFIYYLNNDSTDTIKKISSDLIK